MRLSQRLWTQASRVTFFTSPNCSLCDTAKAVVHKVKSRRPFEYHEVSIRESGQEHWLKYAFDTPVVHIEPTSTPLFSQDTPASNKLMHRMSEEQVEALLDKVEKKPRHEV